MESRPGPTDPAAARPPRPAGLARLWRPARRMLLLAAFVYLAAWLLTGGFDVVLGPIPSNEALVARVFAREGVSPDAWTRFLIWLNDHSSLRLAARGPGLPVGLAAGLLGLEIALGGWWRRRLDPATFKRWLPLVPVLLVGVLARAPGVGYGLPYRFLPDEECTVTPTEIMLKNGSLSPHYSIYPNLTFFWQLAFYRGLYLVRGAPPMEEFLADDASILRVGRIGVLVLGVATLIPVYGLGRLVYGRAAALLASLMLALLPLHVSYSRIIKPDTPATFLVACTAWATLAAIDRRDPRLLTAGAALAALAAASKYNAGFFALWPLLGLVLLWPGWRRGLGQALRMGGAGTLAFALGNPDFFLYPQTMLGGLIYDWQHYRSGHPGLTGQLNWFFYLRGFGRGEGGWLWIIFGLAGLALACVPPRRLQTALAVPPLAYFLWYGKLSIRMIHGLMPILPFLGLAAAGLLLVRLPRLARGLKAGPRTLSVLAWLPAVFMLAESGTHTLRWVSTQGHPETRLRFVRWSVASLAPGSRIGVIEHHAPPVDPQRFSVTHHYPYTQDLAWFAREGIETVVLNSAQYGRYFENPDANPYDTRHFRQFFEDAETTGRLLRVFHLHRWRAPGPDLRVIQPVPARLPDWPPLAAAGGELALVAAAITPDRFTEHRTVAEFDPGEEVAVELEFTAGAAAFAGRVRLAWQAMGRLDGESGWPEAELALAPDETVKLRLEGRVPAAADDYEITVVVERPGGAPIMAGRLPWQVAVL